MQPVHVILLLAIGGFACFWVALAALLLYGLQRATIAYHARKSR